MQPAETKIPELLHETAETHHSVFRLTDGADPDWASWYADHLLRRTELPRLLGTTPVRSELVYLLVKADKDFTERKPQESWEDFYTREMANHFRAPSA